MVLLLLLANILYISGTYNPNPINVRANISSNVQFGTHQDGLYTIDPNDGFTTQALGHEAANDLLHGHMPWWNYNEQVGAPLAGDMQPAALFMPFIFILELSNGVLFLHIILELIAGLATYFLLKKLGLRELPSIVGGSVFALNGTFAWLGNAIFNPIAFLPLLILGIEYSYSSTVNNKKRGWILIALSIAYSLYAGFPEVAYINGLFAMTWAVVRGVQLRGYQRSYFIRKIILGALAGLLLATPIIIAFLDYYPYANVGLHGGGATAIGLPIIGLPALLFPYIYGPIFQYSDSVGLLSQWWGSVGGYLTICLLFVAIIGFVKAFKSKYQLLAIILALWILIALGRTYNLSVISPLVNFFPGISLTAFYRYASSSIDLAAVILAAMGINSLLYEKVIRRKTILIIAGTLTAVTLCLVTIAFHEQSLIVGTASHDLWLWISVAWGLISVWAIYLGAFRFKKYAKFIIPAVILVDSLGMFMLPEFSAPRQAQLDLAPVTYLQKHLGNYRFFSLGPIQPNYGSYYNIASINTNNLPISKSWTSYITQNLDSNVNPVIFTGTTFNSPSGLSPSEALLANLSSYENVAVKYVITAPNVISALTAQQAKMQLVFKDNYSQIFKLPNPKPYFQTELANCSVYSTNRSTVETQCNKPSTLIRRELFLPGWQATINNRAVKVEPQGHIFQKITLPKGSARITFSYLPPHMLLAGVAFVVGVGIVVIGYLPKTKTFFRKD